MNRFMGFKDVQFTNGRKVFGAPVYACFFVFLAGKCGMGMGWMLTGKEYTAQVQFFWFVGVYPPV